jgi:hypothetical protein
MNGLLYKWHNCASAGAMLRNLFEIQESAAAAAAERERENLFCN